MFYLAHSEIIKNLSILNENIESYSIFIESGTHCGNTIVNLLQHFKELNTIELSLFYYDYFNTVKNTENYTNVKNYFGDTVNILPQILQSYSKEDKCLFWLDAHFSSGNTAKGEKDVPLIEECLLIDNFYKAEKGILFIDDFRLFETKEAEDWSGISINNICNCFKNFKIVENFVDNDILVLLIQKL